MKSMIMEVLGNRRGFMGGRILRTLSQQSEQKPITGDSSYVLRMSYVCLSLCLTRTALEGFSNSNTP